MGHCQRGHAGLGRPCWLRIKSLCRILDVCKSFEIILYWDKRKGFFGHWWSSSLTLENPYSLTSYSLARHSAVATVGHNTVYSCTHEGQVSSFKKNNF